MTARFDLIGLVVAGMPRSLAFYRRLGLDGNSVDLFAPLSE
jgi:hypothetical protein